jgi:hypothetical protein
MTLTYVKACDILSIDPLDTTITPDHIKRQYRIKALQFHPDKNKAPDAAEQFHAIHAAYEYLLRNQGCHTFLDEQNTNYASILQSFLSTILGRAPEDKHQLFTTILQRLSSTCEATLINTLDKLDKSMLVKLYELLKKHGHVLHISDSIVQRIERMIIQKHRGDECILLNPTIDDLFDNNLYKLSVGDFQYIVPLWHHELVYDHSGNDIIVKCFPMLNENMYIDERNNLHIELEYRLSELWECAEMSVCVGSRIFRFKVAELHIVKQQTITLANLGISVINTEDVYNVAKKADIYLHIDIVGN